MRKDNSTFLIKEARKAQVNADFRMLGRLINKARTPQERGTIIGMLACEIALRKKNIRQAFRILQLSRSFFADDYVNLLISRQQEKLIRKWISDDISACLLIKKRAEMLNSGQI